MGYGLLCFCTLILTSDQLTLFKAAILVWNMHVNPGIINTFIKVLDTSTVCLTHLAHLHCWRKTSSALSQMCCSNKKRFWQAILPTSTDLADQSSSDVRKNKSPNNKKQCIWCEKAFMLLQHSLHKVSWLVTYCPDKRAGSHICFSVEAVPGVNPWQTTLSASHLPFHSKMSQAN